MITDSVFGLGMAFPWLMRSKRFFCSFLAGAIQISRLRRYIIGTPEAKTFDGAVRATLKHPV
jgi:hypothetical protein